jgi:hypothetical protein
MSRKEETPTGNGTGKLNMFPVNGKAKFGRDRNSELRSMKLLKEGEVLSEMSVSGF